MKVVRTKVVRIFNLTLIRFCDISEAFFEQLITHYMVDALKFLKEWRVTPTENNDVHIRF